MKKCDLLLIDDDDDDIEILSEAFIKSGVDCIHHEDSASKAFTYLNQIKAKEDLPKLIITDFYLNGVTGAEFLNDLKKINELKHIPVIVLSTQRLEKDIDKYRKMGAAEYLVKPSSFNEYLTLANYLKAKMDDPDR